MKPILAIALLAFFASACSSGKSSAAASEADGQSAASLSHEEKHRLYTAALAASESPLDTDLFKEVCKKIGIFDAEGSPNDNYMAFVQEHVAWGMKTETSQFRLEINTKEKAQEYVTKHLSQ